jgi:hypothetical protein
MDTTQFPLVMPGLGSGIHVRDYEGVDGRANPAMTRSGVFSIGYAGEIFAVSRPPLLADAQKRGDSIRNMNYES